MKCDYPGKRNEQFIQAQALHYTTSDIEPCKDHDCSYSEEDALDNDQHSVSGPVGLDGLRG